MIYLKVYMTREVPSFPRSLMPENKIRVLRDEGGEETCFYIMIPRGWLKKGRGIKRLRHLMESGAGLRAGSIPGGGLPVCEEWVCADLADALGWQPPLPGTEWIGKILRQQPLCEAMIVFLPVRMPHRTFPAGRAAAGDGGPTNRYGEIRRALEEEAEYLEAFLQEGYRCLNRLLVVSGVCAGEERLPFRDEIGYYRRIYRESGLVVQLVSGPEVTAAVRIPAAIRTAGDAFPGMPLPGTTLCVDLREEFSVPLHALPEGTRYLDLTSKREKERLIDEKRSDICYTSTRNFLDTYVRNRYNAYCCKMDE